MATITFDTHKFVRKLNESGFEERQAEGIADAFKDASGEAELATKRDIKQIRSEIREFKAEITGELKLNCWMLGAILGMAIANFAKQFL
ncbi:MAG: DUF1640 domain-containing protein [Methylomonas sp.]